MCKYYRGQYTKFIRNIFNIILELSVWSWVESSLILKGQKRIRKVGWNGVGEEHSRQRESIQRAGVERSKASESK